MHRFVLLYIMTQSELFNYRTESSKLYLYAINENENEDADVISQVYFLFSIERKIHSHIEAYNIPNKIIYKIIIKMENLCPLIQPETQQPLPNL
jgi:hypothetical protein